MSDAKEHRRRSTRLRHWDYSWAWWYYVTMVVHDRRMVLGSVHQDKMQLSRLGEIVRDTWTGIPERYKGTELDEYVIMPNHVHGIIILNDSSVGAIHESPLRGETVTLFQEEYIKQRRQMMLSKIAGWFKMNSAKQINLEQRTSGHPFWQRNYYDHIIRDEADLTHIRTYISNNPLQWALDEENPDNI